MQKTHRSNKMIYRTTGPSLWVNPDGDMGQFHSAFASGDNPNGPDFQIDLMIKLIQVVVHWVEYVLITMILEGPFLELNTWYPVLVRDANEQASFM